MITLIGLKVYGCGVADPSDCTLVTDFDDTSVTSLQKSPIGEFLEKKLPIEGFSTEMSEVSPFVYPEVYPEP